MSTTDDVEHNIDESRLKRDWNTVHKLYSQYKKLIKSEKYSSIHNTKELAMAYYFSVKADYHLNKHGNSKKAWRYIESSLNFKNDFPDSLALGIILRLRRDAYKQQNNLFIDFKDNITEYFKKTTKMMKENMKIFPEEFIKDKDDIKETNPTTEDPTYSDSSDSEDDDESESINRITDDIVLEKKLNISYILEHYKDYSEYRLGLFVLSFLCLASKHKALMMQKTDSSQVNSSVPVQPVASPSVSLNTDATTTANTTANANTTNNANANTTNNANNNNDNANTTANANTTNNANANTTNNANANNNNDNDINKKETTLSPAPEILNSKDIQSSHSPTNEPPDHVTAASSHADDHAIHSSSPSNSMKLDTYAPITSVPLKTPENGNTKAHNITFLGSIPSLSYSSKDSEYSLYYYLSSSWQLLIDNYQHNNTKDTNNIFYILTNPIFLFFIPLLTQLPKLSSQYVSYKITIDLYRQLLLALRDIHVTTSTHKNKQDSQSSNENAFQSNTNPSQNLNDSFFTDDKTAYIIIQDIYMSIAVEYIHYLNINISQDIYVQFPKCYKVEETTLPKSVYEEILYIYNCLNHIELNKLTTEKYISLISDVAISYYHNNQCEQSIQMLEEAIVFIKTSPSLWLLLGNIYTYTNKYQKALICYDNCYNDCFNLVASSVSLSFPAIYPLILSARMNLLYLNRIDDCIHNCDSILTHTDNDTPSIIIQAHYYKALCIFTQAKYSSIYWRTVQLYTSVEEELQTAYQLCIHQNIHVSPCILYLYAYVLFEQGKYEACISLITTFISLYKFYSPIYILFTLVLSAYKDSKSALDACRMGLDIDPDNIYLLYLQAILHYHINGSIKAEPFFNILLKQLNKAVSSLVDDSVPNTTTKNPINVLNNPVTLVQRYEGTKLLGGLYIYPFDQSVPQKAPREHIAELLSLLCDYYISINNIEQSKGIYTYMEKLYQDKFMELKALLLFYDAVYASKLGKYEESIKILNDALLYSPDIMKIHQFLGDLYCHEAKSIISSDSTNENPLINSANKISLYDAVHSAETHYKMITNQNPHYTTAWYSLGDLYKLLGYDEKASNAFFTALEYDKQLPILQFSNIIIPI